MLLDSAVRSDTDSSHDQSSSSSVKPLLDNFDVISIVQSAGLAQKVNGDPLAAGLWRLYTKAQYQLPQAKRFENLIWRRMAIKLVRPKLETTPPAERALNQSKDFKTKTSEASLEQCQLEMDTILKELQGCPQVAEPSCRSYKLSQNCYPPILCSNASQANLGLKSQAWYDLNYANAGTTTMSQGWGCLGEPIQIDPLFSPTTYSDNYNYASYFPSSQLLTDGSFTSTFDMTPLTSNDLAHSQFSCSFQLAQASRIRELEHQVNILLAGRSMQFAETTAYSQIEHQQDQVTFSPTNPLHQSTDPFLAYPFNNPMEHGIIEPSNSLANKSHKVTPSKPKANTKYTSQSSISCDSLHASHSLNKNHELASMACTNCGVTKTSLWRRSSHGEPLCNACGLFLKLHGKERPLSMKTDVIRKRNRGANPTPSSYKCAKTSGF